MVVGAFPAAKLGALLLKQISKPVANLVKTQAKNSPVFSKYVCMPPAQFYNFCEVKAKMWVLNLGKPVNIPVLNEQMAIELGANLLGEGIIFAIAAGILINEYARSSRKEAAKEEEKKQELLKIHNTIRELFIQSEEQGAHIRELTRKLGELENKIPGGRNLKPKRTGTDQKPPKTDQTLSETDPTPPINLPLPSPERNHPIESSTEDELLVKNDITQSSFILEAVRDIEDQFWNYPSKRREESLVKLSLYHLQRILSLHQ